MLLTSLIMTIILLLVAIIIKSVYLRYLLKGLITKKSIVYLVLVFLFSLVLRKFLMYYNEVDFGNFPVFALFTLSGASIASFIYNNLHNYPCNTFMFHFNQYMFSDFLDQKFSDIFDKKFENISKMKEEYSASDETDSDKESNKSNYEEDNVVDRNDFWNDETIKTYRLSQVPNSYIDTESETGTPSEQWHEYYSEIANNKDTYKMLQLLVEVRTAKQHLSYPIGQYDPYFRNEPSSRPRGQFDTAYVAKIIHGLLQLERTLKEDIYKLTGSRDYELLLRIHKIPPWKPTAIPLLERERWLIKPSEFSKLTTEEKQDFYRKAFENEREREREQNN